MINLHLKEYRFLCTTHHIMCFHRKLLWASFRRIFLKLKILHPENSLMLIYTVFVKGYSGFKKGGAQKLNFRLRVIIFLKKVSHKKESCEVLKLHKYFKNTSQKGTSSVIRLNGVSQTGVSRKQSTVNFRKNEHFLPLDTHTYVCVSGSEKYSFFGKFGVLCFLETPVLRFTLLPS